MGIDYRLACIECKQYLDLHKWCPHENALLGIDRCNGYEKYSACKTDIENIFSSIEIQKMELLIKSPDHWIAAMIPFVEEFCLSHKLHDLVIFCDKGDMPWYPDEAHWYNWKEVIAPMSCIDISVSDVDLPLNIIEDLNITDWVSAKKHYLENCPCVDNLGELEQIFKGFLSAKKIHNNTP